MSKDRYYYKKIEYPRAKELAVDESNTTTNEATNKAKKVLGCFIFFFLVATGQSLLLDHHDKKIARVESQLGKFSPTLQLKKNKKYKI